MAAAQTTATQGGKIAKALVAAQADLPPVERDAQNPHFRSAFTSLGHLLAKVRPVLNKHGLAVMQFPSHNEQGPTLTTLILHESGERLEYEAPLLLTKNDPQGQGSAITYMRRYALSGALGISDQDDDDGEGAREKDAGNGRSRPKVNAQKPKATETLATPDQRRLIFAKAKEAGLAEDELRQLIQTVAGTTHTDRLPKAKVDELLGLIAGELVSR